MTDTRHTDYNGNPRFTDGELSVDFTGHEDHVEIDVNEERQDYMNWYDHTFYGTLNLDRDNVLILAQALWDWLDSTVTP